MSRCWRCWYRRKRIYMRHRIGRREGGPDTETRSSRAWPVPVCLPPGSRLTADQRERPRLAAARRGARCASRLPALRPPCMCSRGRVGALSLGMDARPAGITCYAIPRGSKHEPSEYIQRIVVACIASKAVVVRSAPIEVPIGGVLQQEAHVASRQPVEFENIAAGLRAAGRAAGYSLSGVVEKVVSIPSGPEVRHGCPIFLVEVVGGFALERPQPVGWIACGTRAKGRVQVLLFSNPVDSRGEAMTVGNILILGIDSNVAEAVGGSGWIEAVGKLPDVDPIGADHCGLLCCR